MKITNGLNTIKIAQGIIIEILFFFEIPGVLVDTIKIAAAPMNGTVTIFKKFAASRCAG